MEDGYRRPTLLPYRVEPRRPAHVGRERPAGLANRGHGPHLDGGRGPDPGTGVQATRRPAARAIAVRSWRTASRGIAYGRGQAPSQPPVVAGDAIPLFYLIASGFAVLSLVLLVLAVRAFRGRRWLGSIGRGGTGVLFLSLAALAAVLGASTQGYRALTLEEVAATITTVPTGPRAFQAYVELPDGRDTTVAVTGDQLLVDAHILKWRPLANILGVHTQYELDRLGGRYLEIEDERSASRTVHSLKTGKPVDLFHLARRYTLLSLLVDTEYGSATYIEVERPARFEIRVSTTGLLVREVELQ